MLVLGNQVGKIFVWDLTVDEPNKLRYSPLLELLVAAEITSRPL